MSQRLERIDAITGGRERTEAFLDQVQGNRVVSLSYGMAVGYCGLGFELSGIIDANAYTVPKSRGVIVRSEGIVDLVRSPHHPDTRSTQMVKYYDDRRVDDPAVKRLKVEQFEVQRRSNFKGLDTFEHRRFVMLERVVLDGDSRKGILGALGLSDVPSKYSEEIVEEFPDCNVTFSLGAAEHLVDALQTTRHPMGRGISLAVATALQSQKVALANL